MGCGIGVGIVIFLFFLFSAFAAGLVGLGTKSLVSSDISRRIEYLRIDALGMGLGLLSSWEIGEVN
jgi:hypothetical protein